MAVSQLGTNAPNGSVNVNGWLRNAENDRYSPGVINGFTPSFSGMSITPAGGSSSNSCLATNQNGDTEVFGLNVPDTTTLQLSAPKTSGQSVVYSIVAYRDVTARTANNNGVGTVGIVAVAGIPTTTANASAPTDTMIRSAIPNGSTAYLCVLMNVKIAYGTNVITSSMVVVQSSSLNAMLSHTGKSLAKSAQRNVGAPVGLTDYTNTVVFTLPSDRSVTVYVRGVRFHAGNQTRGHTGLLLDNAIVPDGSVQNVYAGGGGPEISTYQYFVTYRLFLTAGTHSLSATVSADSNSGSAIFLDSAIIEVIDA